LTIQLSVSNTRNGRPFKELHRFLKGSRFSSQELFLKKEIKDISNRVIEKRHERRQDKAKIGEKAEFILINEYVELNFNTVLTSVIDFNSLLGQNKYAP